MIAAPAEPASSGTPARADAFAIVLLALGCVAGAWLGSRIAFEPGAAPPLNPAAGIALAAALVHGRAALAAIAVALAGAAWWHAVATGVPVVAGIAVALTAVVEAAAGRWLARRVLAQPITLSAGRELLRFALAVSAPAAALGATLAVAAQWGGLEPPLRASAWWGAWVGDVLGMVIGVPIVLTLIGVPTSAWAPRRLTVGLPLLLATVLLVTAGRPVAEWERQRRVVAFENHARQTADAIAGTLHQPLHALQALHSAVLANPALDRGAMRQATAFWLAEAAIPLQALGLSERVARADLAAFEAVVRGEGLRDYRVFDRPDGGRAADDEVVAIRFIEPLQGNAGALGVNALSVPAAATAIQQARDSGQPRATVGFALTQRAGDPTGVVVYQALYRGAAADPAARQAAFRGVAFAAVRIDRAIDTMMARVQPPLRACLVDLDPKVPQRRLGGVAGCEDEPRTATLSHLRRIEFAGRDWQLRLSASPATAAAVWQHSGWLFSVVGLLGAAVFGALLLSVTGRARLIAQAVDERTGQLRHEAAERERTEQALRDSERRLRSLLDHVPIGVVEADIEGRIRETNPRMREMLGRGAEELARLSLADLTHPDDRDEDDALLHDLLSGEAAMYRRQKRLLGSGGRTLWAQVGVSVLRDADGRPLRLVGVVEDITEHLMLLEAERERERAETSSRAKSEFVSRMSHELRTPLNAMLGFAQLLALDRKPVLSGQQLAWTTQIQQAGWHLLNMINDTLDLSRIESGMLSMESVPVEIEPLLRESLAMIGAAAEARGLTVARTIEPAVRAALGDPTRIKQVLTNLLSNAVKYNVDGGRVDVTVRTTVDRQIEIAIADSGLGMTDSQLGALFQPFNRLGRERSSVEGTGLGLVISRRLAEMMGGSLSARSVPGQGSTFVLLLAPAAGDAAVAAAPAADVGIADAWYRQRLVHYVEDNPTNVEVMRGVLAQRPQIRLDVSVLGLDGLAAIRGQRPSLVLLDMHLPDIDGLELLRHLKQDPDVGDIPVIVVSADASSERIEQALTAGAAHYQTKPVAVASFLEVVDELLQVSETRFG